MRRGYTKNVMRRWGPKITALRRVKGGAMSNNLRRAKEGGEGERRGKEEEEG